jgi:hypothetical protein
MAANGTGRRAAGTGATAEAPQVPGFARFMIWFMRSPFAGLAGGLVLVRYTGRRSGLARQLPVGVERYEKGWLIRVGRPQEKRWWRNFTEPAPIELVRGRRVIRGTGVVVLGTTEPGRRIAEAEFARHGGYARRAGLARLPKGEGHSPAEVAAAAAPLVFVMVTPDGAAN